MSWNDGEVTVVPHQIKKPSYANHRWKKSWKANYKGEDFYITKAPKGHYGENDRYEVRWKWKGRHPKNDNTDIIPELIDLDKLKTMPQVKKLIRTFVDGINNGKLVDVETGKPLTFNTFDTCTACSIWARIPNLYHRQNMFTHKALWDRNEFNKKPYQCKWHTKLDVLEAMKEDANTKLENVDKMDIFDYKRKIESQINRLKKKGRGIDVDALVPDSELIQMFNPRQEIFEKRRRMKKKAETFEANDMIKERYFQKQLKKYEDKLDWGYLSMNPALTPALIEKYKDKLHWEYLSMNHSLTPAFIEKYEDKLGWHYLSSNPVLTPALIEKYEDKLDWYYLSYNPALTPALIEKYENKLEWDGLSRKLALTPALIEKYKDKLRWAALSKNRSLTPALIEKYENELNWSVLSENPSLTPAFIEKYKDKLDWRNLSLNPSLTPAFIEKYIDKYQSSQKLNWKYLSQNPALTPAIIEKYENKWSWNLLSQNPALTPALIEKYKDKVNWIVLSRNPALFGNLHIKKAEEGKKKRNPLLYGAIIVAIFSYIKS